VKCKTTLRKIRGLIVVVALMSACSVLPINTQGSVASRKWLNFFFDGVPPETTATNKPAGLLSTNLTHAVAVAIPATPKAPVNTFHKPFQDGKCSACHGTGNTMSPVPRLPLRQLCFTCHTNFTTGMKAVHQPVGDGDCLACHDPHQSPYKKLVTKKGNDLCLNCHDDPLQEGKFHHQAVESGDCLDCHAPHATNNKGLLKQPIKATCYACHDDLAGKKKDVHQPVDDGDCTACHAPHAAADKNLLKKTGPALCWQCHDNFLDKVKFTHDVVEDCNGCHNPHATDVKELLNKGMPALCYDCHDPKDLAKDKGHKDTGTKSCTDCHDPHSGNNVNLLKPAALGSGATKGSAP
jgi:predicted CXXCH cytochrome family protein